MANVHISAQSFIQGGQSDGEMVEASPAPEAHQEVMGEGSPTPEALQDLSAVQNESKVCDA